MIAAPCSRASSRSRAASCRASASCSRYCSSVSFASSSAVLGPLHAALDGVTALGEDLLEHREDLRLRKKNRMPKAIGADDELGQVRQQRVRLLLGRERAADADCSTWLDSVSPIS